MPFATGFVRSEALDLVTLCAIIEGNPLAKPAGWSLIFDSPEIGPFKDKWQLWHNSSGPYAIVLRGTVANPGSILEDLISFLTPATGAVTVGPFRIPFKFADDLHASVHVGFTLGTLLLLKDPLHGILTQLAARVPAGSQIYISGHSQGAAEGTLLRSYLEYGADRPKSKNYSYKTYVFAQPKPGNDHYAYDFEARFCNGGLAFRVTNSLDWVPQVPFTIEIPSDINTPNPLSVLSGPLAASLSTLTQLGQEVRTLIVHTARSRLEARAAALVRAAAPNAPAELLTHGFDIIPIAPSLNFTGAGTEISLIGTPCVGAQCNDVFFEHHAVTYLQLMKAQLP
jgi:hypothetical protein